MKKICKIAMLFCVLATVFSCDKNNKPEDPIDMENHYDMVYMLGAAADGKWDSKDPLSMTKTEDLDVFVYELDLVRSSENKLVKFSLAKGEWNEVEFLVPVKVEEGQSFAFLKEGVNELSSTSEKLEGVGNLRDHFFGMAKGTSGRYKLEVNPIKKTLKATKLSSIKEPEIIEWVEGNVYMVGDATPNGWEIGNPTPMKRDGDIHTYEGILKAGEMKFPTKFSWDGEFYHPAVDKTEISKSGIADEKVEFYAGGDDKKWLIKDQGKYKLTLDAKALTLKVQWLGEN
jgi:hypothetical protein